MAHPERAKESVRRWRAKNPEKFKETQRLWRLANPEKVKEMDRRGHAAMYKRRKGEREQAARWKQSLEKMTLPLTSGERYKAKKAFNRRMDLLLIQWSEEKPNEFTI